MLESWEVGMLECWKVGMLECWNVGKLGSREAPKLESYVQKIWKAGNWKSQVPQVGKCLSLLLLPKKVCFL